MASSKPQSNKKTHLNKARIFSRWLLGIIAGTAVLGILVMLSLPYNKDPDTKKSNSNGKSVKERRGGSLTGSINGHDWVDLGLPSGLRWATCNVGADMPEEYGDYYAWGETTTKNDYSTINSLTYKVTFRKLKDSGIIDGYGILTKDHDAASVNWVEPWRMPTEDEYQELITSCVWTFASYNDVNGYIVTGPNKKSIFLPAAAFQQNTKIDNLGEFGDYWSSTVVPELSGVACSLGYSSKSYGRRRYARYAGRTIRPVTDND